MADHGGSDYSGLAPLIGESLFEQLETKHPGAFPDSPAAATGVQPTT
jgi:hypothetical protein